MSRVLPPLHLLAVFEACARLGSFRLASEELFITPSAVSHQVKALESQLGFSLFVREGRGVNLSNAGKLYFEYIHDAINLMEEGTRRVKSKHASPSLKISTFSSLASKVVIPQLAMFQQAHPEIDIRLETSTDMSDLRYEDYDLALRLGKGDWKDVSVHKLFDIEIGIVCTKAFAEKVKLTSPAQLSKVPLIEMNNIQSAWQRWFERSGQAQVNPEFSLSFNSYDATIIAAEQGLGLALAMFPVENHSLETGALIEPFKQRILYEDAIFAVYRKGDENRHDIECFLSWLKQHA